jgi:Tfp pilus assembly protein PilF
MIKRNYKTIVLLFIFMTLLQGCRASQNQIEKADSFYNAGVVYMEKGDFENALESLKNARNLDPNSSRIYNALGLIYYKYGMNDKAVECYLKSLELKNNAPEIRNNLAAVYLTLGEYQKAIEQCELAIKNKAYLSPSAAYFNMAQAYYFMGNLSQAKISYAKSLNNEPHFDRAHFGYAMVLKETNDMTNAVKHLKTCIEINPEYVEAYYELGIILFDSHADDKARTFFQKVLELAPNSEISMKAQNFIKAIDGRKKTQQ